MQDGKRTLEECLIEAGFWNEEDGAFGADERSLGIVLDRVQERLAQEVMLIFYNFDAGDARREASVAWRNQSYTLVIGSDFSDALCKTALALPSFLKDHPECAAKGGASLETT
jgi:hypothetical protein